MSALSPAIYESIEISAETTNGSKKTIELNLGVVKINIFEDLFSPTITAQVLVVSSGGAVPTTNKEGESEPDTMDSVYSGLPIRGGERVSIKIANNTDNNLWHCGIVVLRRCGIAALWQRVPIRAQGCDGVEDCRGRRAAAAALDNRRERERERVPNVAFVRICKRIIVSTSVTLTKK